jgi:ribonuclease PH
VTDEVDLVEADLEGLFVAVTGLTLALLIAMNAFDGIGSMNHCVTGILIHTA